MFESVDTVVEAGGEGELFTADDGSACSDYLGRECESNTLTSSGTFSQSDSDVLSKFSGAEVADATAASEVKSYVSSNAGIGKLSQ